MSKPIYVYLLMMLFAVSCKKNSDSDTKSFIGLQANLDREIANGKAPSFVALQDWFSGRIPVDESKSQTGGIKYKVHNKFGNQSWSSVPTEYKSGLVKYFQQQIIRVADFQKSLKDPKKLNELLKLEATEMYDVIRALVDPEYQPITQDLLAHLVSQPNLRNYVDRFSVEFLEKIYQRSQRSVIANLAKERDNFADLLVGLYLDSKGHAKPQFTEALKKNCALLKQFVELLGESPTTSCDAGQNGFSLSSESLDDATKVLPGAGHKFSNLFSGATSKSGPASTLSTSPSLSIFSGKDPGAGDPSGKKYAGNTPNGGEDAGEGEGKAGVDTSDVDSSSPDISTSPSTSPSSGSIAIPKGKGMNMLGLLSKLFPGGWHQMLQKGMGLEGLQDPLSKDLSLGEAELPSEPIIDCVQEGHKGMDLVRCQRYAALPVMLESKPASSHLASDAEESLQLDSDQDYSLFIVANHASPVQNQGTEGACSAYGVAHTIEATLSVMGTKARSNAASNWQKQGRKPYAAPAIKAAQSTSYNGKSLTGSSRVSGLSGIKRALASGKAVFTLSPYSTAWQRPSGGALPCGNTSAQFGHFYSIQGYDDTKQVVIIKNSWGDSWGEQGYYYLPYKCLTSSAHLQRSEFYTLSFD
jgi:hypothetical protein